MIGLHFDGANVSEAWLKAIAHVRKHGDTYHLAVHIQDMTAENTAIRKRVNMLLEEADFPPVSTVRNTIFPKSDVRFAKGNVAELVSRYRSTYDFTRRFPGNAGGTYFGRLVGAKTTAGGRSYDQLSNSIEKLSEKGVNDTRTEVDFSDAEDLDGSAAVGIYQSESDAQKRMGFPCLSHLAFQRDSGLLHAVAFYRNQDMVEKAYGNYLGIGELTAYIARHAGLRPGALTVIAGRATVKNKRLLDTLLAATSGTKA